MIEDLSPTVCPIRPGLKIPKSFFGLMGPRVQEVGKLMRACDGWVAPVRYTDGACALLRWYKGNGVTSVSRVEEVRSNSFNAQWLLENSALLPEVMDSPDPGILQLRVVDIEHEDTPDACEVHYELRLMGILGHLGERDEVIPILGRLFA